ncbi:MAG: hypothetical protein IT379_33610 [Deltaproteobacteria bacterium]|nr:hypothetical protein [Deltaproteobacteria bacterium]
MSRISGSHSCRPLAAALACVAATVGSFAHGPRVRACGDPGPTFVPAIARAEMLPAFARGNLGVVSPRWQPQYLVVAYRHLTGNVLSERETASILGSWLGTSDPGPSDPSEPWRTARRELTGADSPAVATWRSTRHHAYYEVCPADAFRVAARVARERARTWGAQSAELRDWVAAQDSVFAGCVSADAPMPAPPARDWPASRAADRRYQIAAAHLYRERFDEALRAFDAISADTDSPWREMAPYLAARALVRKATLTADPFDPTSMREAERRLVALSADSSRPGAHAPAARLLDLVRHRLEPDAQIQRLAELLSRAGAGPTAAQSDDDAGRRLVDLVRLLDEALHQRTPAERARTLGASDLLAWIDVMHGPAERAVETALSRHGRQRSDAWLVAALTYATPSNARTPRLLSLAATVDRSSPAFPTVAFHRVRLLALSGRAAEARAVLRGLPLRDWLPPARDAFRALALHVAPDLRSWLQSAERTEVLDEPSRALHEDARAALRAHLPLEHVAAVTASDVLSVASRIEIARAGFVRALLLERHALARVFARRIVELAASAPEVADLRRYLGSTGGDRTAVGLLVVLRHDSTFGEPGIASLQLPSNRPACPRVLCDVSDPSFVVVTGLGAPALPADLGVEPRRRGEDEAARTLAEGTLLNLLGRHVLAWAERDTADARVPEALHRLVSATRRASFHSTSDARTGRISHRAFRILHSRYPNDEWTSRTRHWYR